MAAELRAARGGLTYARCDACDWTGSAPVTRDAAHNEANEHNLVAHLPF